MAFSTIPFLFAFLPAALILYRIVPARARAVVLIILSLVFYAWGDVRHLPVLLFSIAFNYFAGMELGLLKQKNAARAARSAMILAVGVNLFLLGYYKYAGFFSDSLAHLVGRETSATAAPLPIGISFFTFSAISYILDIYMERARFSRNFIQVAAYICMFPKLISGPIVQYKDMKGRFIAPKMTMSNFLAGTQKFVVGLFKKVLLADALGVAFANIQALDGMAAATAWLGMIFYGLQLFFDFSGYSDMAIGLAQILGFPISRNFDYPYISDSIGDFWRRWHISLGSWFREYVYIPLGGNRCSVSRQILNLLVVWLLTGLWHGAAWTFVFWGLWHGILIILERFILKNAAARIPQAARTAVTVLLVFIGWVFFFSPSMGSAFSWLGQMFGAAGMGVWNGTTGYFLRTNLITLIAAIICCGPNLGRTVTNLSYQKGRFGVIISVAVYIVLFLCCISYIVGSSYNSFLYFQF